MTSKPQDTTQAKDELADLKADFGNLREDVAELANSFKAFLDGQQPHASTKPASTKEGTAAEATGPAGEEESEWQEFRRKLDEARQHTEQTIDDLNEEVVQHPLASLAVAFGVGYLAAKLLR